MLVRVMSYTGNTPVEYRLQRTGFSDISYFMRKFNHSEK